MNIRGIMVVCAQIAVTSVSAEDYILDKITTAEETYSGASIAQPSGEGITYSSAPFVLNQNGKHFLRLSTGSAKVDQGSVNQHAVTEISDYGFRLSFLDNTLRMDVDSGSYNWFDPFGETWKTAPYFELLRGQTTYRKSGLYLHGGMTRWPHVYWLGWATEGSELVMDGGIHEFCGLINMPYGSGNFNSGVESYYDFVVSNTAKVVINSTLTMGTRDMGVGDSSLKTMNFTVRDGGEVTLNGTFTQSSAGKQNVLVDNATLKIGSAGTIKLGAQTEAEAAAIEGSANFINGATVGNEGIFATYAGVTTFRNSTLSSSLDGVAQLQTYPGTLRFENSSVTNKFIRFGRTAGQVSRIEFKDSDFQLPSVNDGEKCFIGDAGTAEVIVDGGIFCAKQIDLGGEWYWNIFQASTGTVDIVGGAQVSINSLNIGKQYGGKGRLNLSDGTLTVSSGMTLGRSGVAEFVMSGGTATISSINFGTSTQASLATAPGTNLLHVTDGTLNVTHSRDDSYGITGGSHLDARPGLIVLDGGVVTARRLYGGNAAAVNGGNGWSGFTADGGTLAANSKTTNFFYGFDSALLGAKGLTVDADFDVTLAQPFADLPGANGRLILAGAGVKTLTGDSSGLSETVVREGTVDLSGAHMGGLTLDGGILSLSSAQPVSVAGDLVVVGAEFALDAGFELGTTKTIFSVGGEISEASKAALAESMIVSGLAAGLAFDIGYDTESDPGKILVTLTVREVRTVVIEATEGPVVDSDDHSVSAVDTLQAKSASGASLTLEGKLGRGNFEKRGAGVVTLANEANLFLGSLYLFEGKLSVSSMLALGYDAAGAGVFYLKGGTLELADAANPAVFPYDLNVSPDAENAAVVIKTDEDTVFRKMTPANGAIIKRGKGDLVFESKTAMDLVTGNGTIAIGGSPIRPATGFAYDDQGTVPPTTASYGGLNVIEGELALRGTGDVPAAIALTENVCIGLPTATRSVGAVDPSLVLDNVAVTMNNGTRPSIYVGGGASDDNTVFTSPRLVVSNGATVTMHNLMVNRNTASDSKQSAEVLIDGGTIVCKNRVFANACGRGTTASRFVIRNGGALYVENSLDCYGMGTFGPGANNAITLVADTGVVAKNAAGEPTNFNAGNESSTLVFTNGARFCCSGLTYGASLAGGQNVFTFDDSEWYPGATDFIFADNVGKQSRYVASGRGLILAPPANVTYTWAKKLEGAGGLVKGGEGTLVMQMQNLEATGTIVVEAGTLDLDGTTATGRVFSGSGAIRNGALESPVIKVAKGVAGLDLGTIAPTGRVYVDFSEYGDEIPLKTAIPVARVSGSVNLSKWRGKNLGTTGVKATFAVQDGVVLATVDYAGLMLLVR